MKLPATYATISANILEFCKIIRYHLQSVMSRQALDEMIINYMRHKEWDHESLSDRQWKQLHKNLIYDLRAKYGADREKAFMLQLHKLLKDWDAYIKIEDATLYARSEHFRPCGISMGSSTE